MKSKDLMIGDFVKCCKQDCGSHQVDCIKENGDIRLGLEAWWSDYAKWLDKEFSKIIPNKVNKI